MLWGDMKRDKARGGVVCASFQSQSNVLLFMTHKTVLERVRRDRYGR